MPTHVCVPPLRSLCLDVLGSSVIKFISNRRCQCGSNQEQHELQWILMNSCEKLKTAHIALHRILPPVLLQEVLNRIISKTGGITAFHFGAMQILLGPSTFKVFLQSDPYIFRSATLQTIQTCANNLRELALNCMWLRPAEIPLLEDILKGASHLQSISIRLEKRPDMDSVMQCLGSNCGHLIKLDIQDCPSPSEVGIDSLLYPSAERQFYLRNSLEVLKVGTENWKLRDFDASLMAKLLLACSNLRVLGNYAWGGNAVCIASHKKVDLKLSLKYILDTKTDVSHMKGIMRCCPHVVSVEMVQPTAAAVRKMGTSGEFIVKELTIHSKQLDGLLQSGSCEDDAADEKIVKGYLQQKGKDLQLLSLDAPSCTMREMQLQMRSFPLHQVAELCPNLQVLFLNDMEISWNNIGTFHNVKHLSIWSCLVTYEVHPVNGIPLLSLIGAFPSLTHLRIHSMDHIEDQEFLQFLCKNPLPNLERILIQISNKLGDISLGGLITFCPELEWIGCVDRWSGITQPYLKQTRETIKRNNHKLLISELESKWKDDGSQFQHFYSYRY